jgi:hypothetical protein
VRLLAGAQAIAELPSGKIVLAGCETLAKGSSSLAIQLLNDDGSVDRGFGSEGILWTQVSPGSSTCVSAIVRTPDGGELVVGDAARSLAVARAGPHIYLAGIIRRGEQRPRVVLLRFDRDGRLDRSFGHAGRRVGPHPELGVPTAIIPLRGGILVVLDGGVRPLLLFGRNGGVRRQPVGRQAGFVDRVRAAVSGGRLVLGWSSYSDAIHGPVFYFGSRPLRRAQPGR